jgi:hypothetical protein
VLTFAIDRNNHITAISPDKPARGEPEVLESGSDSAGGMQTPGAREAHLRNANVVSMVPLLKALPKPTPAQVRRTRAGADTGKRNKLGL